MTERRRIWKYFTFTDLAGVSAVGNLNQRRPDISQFSMHRPVIAICGEGRLGFGRGIHKLVNESSSVQVGAGVDLGHAKLLNSEWPEEQPTCRKAQRHSRRITAKARYRPMSYGIVTVRDLKRATSRGGVAACVSTHSVRAGKEGGKGGSAPSVEMRIPADGRFMTFPMHT
jgi:hypothetical protein